MTDNKTISRRTLVKTGLGALAAPAVLRVVPAQAQSAHHQDRPCQPEDRTARRLRRSRRLHSRAGARHPEQGPQERRQDLQGRDHLQGQPVDRQPRLGSGVRTDPRRQGQPASSPRPRPTPPIRSPTRPRSTRCPASPPTARGSLISSAARATRRKASPGLIISSGAWRTSSPPPADVGRIADQQGGRRTVPQRRRRQCLGRSANTACRRR